MFNLSDTEPLSLLVGAAVTRLREYPATHTYSRFSSDSGHKVLRRARPAGLNLPTGFVLQDILRDDNRSLSDLLLSSDTEGASRASFIHSIL